MLKFLIIVAAAGAFIYYAQPIFKKFAPEEGSAPHACTTEAKICPDGTSVGRSGPSCAFTDCPMP